MEVLKILFWVVVLAADIAFMRNIPRIADEFFPIEEKRPGGAGTPARGRRQKMTGLVYQITKEDASDGFQGI